MRDYYRLSTHDALRNVQSSPAGLSSGEAQKRLLRDGYNELPEVQPPSWLHVFITQFQSPLIYILFVAAVIIFFVGPDRYDAFIISGILLFNAVIGTIQEGRTHSILQSLKKFLAADCIVIRDGKHLRIPDRELVLGDIIVLQAGQRVPADARVLQAHNLTIDESMLTGESVATTKTTDPVPHQASLADQTNMLFRGTYILAGTGQAIVTATGLATQIGTMHITIQHIQTDMPLKRELTSLSYRLLIIIFVMCLLLFGIGLISGKPIRELLIMLTALFICIVPEGLPVVLTLVLTSGVYRMAKQHVLIKNMQAVEGLGRTDVIVTDKTGTLTHNQMMVTTIYADNHTWTVTGDGYDPQGTVTCADDPSLRAANSKPLHELGTASLLLNTAHISIDQQTALPVIEGDPTEAALSIMAEKLGLKKTALEQEYTLLYAIPFDSAWQYHARFYKHHDQGKAYIIGAPERVINYGTSKDTAMTEHIHTLSTAGLRLIAIATTTFDLAACDQRTDQQACFTKIIEHGLTILGLCGMQDAIRAEVKQSIHEVQHAGIRVVMATGDHVQTATYVAREVGILTSTETHNDQRIVDGTQLDRMNDEQLQASIDGIQVFARVLPEHKMRIIHAYHARGLMVAMTGDGINDAPSLVAADLGIGMGQIGSEVAKEASDIILLDDSFVNIVRAVEQSRHIFYALKRVILYFFATNFSELLVIMIALIGQLPLPLLPAQILWLNLVTDGFLDVALSTEPREEGLLKQEWRTRQVTLIDWNMMLRTAWMAIPMALGSIAIFIRYYQHDVRMAQTMTLLTMAMFSWFNAWNCRSMTQSIFTLGLLSNRWLLLASGFVLCLQAAIIYVPFMNALFKTVPLSGSDILLIITVASSIILLEEVRKYIAQYQKGW